MSHEPPEEPSPPPFARALPPPPFAEFAPRQALPAAAIPPAALPGAAFPPNTFTPGPVPPGGLPPPPFARHVPAPVPADALAYSLPSTRAGRTRPKLVTVMGTISVVLACLGVLVSVATMVFAAAFYVAAKDVDRVIALAPGAPAGPPPFLAVADPAPPKVEVGPDGLPDPQRRVAVNALYSLHPLRPPRMEQLDAILARAGQRILALERVAPLRAEQVRSSVLDHGELFGGSRRSAPPEYFKTAAGRLELHDDRAIFYPEDGSPPVRSTTASASMPRPLTPEQAQAVVKQVQAAPNGPRLNPAQVSAMTAVLSMPNQKLAQVSRGLSGEPRGVTTHAGGEATIKFSGGELHLGTMGQILPEAPAAGAPPPKGASVAAFVSTIVAAVASLGLAVLLFVAAVATLRRTGRRSAAGRRLHAAWAVLKIPVTAGGAAALCWMFSSLLVAVSRAPRGAAAWAGRGPVSPVRAAEVGPAVVIAAAVLACVYPLAVLVLLRRKSVKEYFNPTE